MSDLVVKPLAPALAGDFLRFFDHERGPAFADNPEWAKCYCHYYEVPVAIDWPSLSAAQNRIAIQARIEVGEMEGFLAYDGDEPVGWLNAQPRHKLPHCFDRMCIAPTPLPCAAYQAAVIVCFVIAPARRRQGVARALLAGALSSLAARGFILVDAFPFKSGDSESAADHYHGALPMFTAAGFAPLAETETITVMRKFLR
ncbi:MAG: GNAT family N-acetyltransferase [Burkholderiales bacterium]